MQASDDPHEVLCDVILVISCGYEDDTEWGVSVRSCFPMNVMDGTCLGHNDYGVCHYLLSDCNCVVVSHEEGVLNKPMHPNCVTRVKLSHIHTNISFSDIITLECH